MRFLAKLLVAGSLLVAPASAQIGDDVVILSGTRTPFLSRERQGTGTSQLVAPAYIEGVMEGELWDANIPLDHFSFV